VLVFGNGNDVVAAAFVSSAVIAIAGYLTARKSRRSIARSILFGSVVLGAGLSMATLKAALSQ
jgi:hypothetical protein